MRYQGVDLHKQYATTSVGKERGTRSPLSLGLWLALRSGEMKPSEACQLGPVVQDLIRYLEQYKLLNEGRDQHGVVG
jgi:hypothetical protein